MQLHKAEPTLVPNVNVFVCCYDNGRLVQRKEVHNVITDTGQEWVMNRLAASSLAIDPPLPMTTALPKYIGVGVGGVLQPDNTFANTQVEVASVEWVEDPIPLANGDFMKQVEANAGGTRHRPNRFTNRYIAKFLETDLAFIGQTTGISGVQVDTVVEVSEAGLYLSTADLGYTPGTANDMICYATFDPISVRPGRVVEFTWEFRI